ncbi:MAG: AMP-binding protein [Clostridia bacterium]|nr:AMP-binding protein [Clostridia bacterium]
MNMPKLPKIVKSSITEKTQPVKVHKQPMTKREYERVADIRDFMRVIEKHGDRIAFTYFEKGRKLKDVTYGELSAQVKKVAGGFNSLGLKGSRVAIIGETSVAWVSAYLAAMVEGHVVIPMDKELEISQIEAFLESVDADVIVYSASFNDKFSEAKLTHKTLKTFVAIDPDEAELQGDNTISFTALMERGATAIEAGYAYPPVENRDALAELLFTSGTTGTSKKVMLSQKNIFSVVTAAAATVDFKPDDTIVSVLPIHHTYELACMLAGLDYGMHICINDSLTRVLKNFQIFKPTGLVLVPLFVYTIYKKIWAEAKKTGRDKKLKVGIGASRAMRAVGIDKRRELFADVVDAFGGRLEKIICGGAALNPKMIEFFDNIGISIYEGFGITECAPLTCVAPYYARKFGSVGPAVPCCQVRIVGDMKNDRGYTEGEIQVKGDNVMLGYYDNPEATAEVFTEDGWFRTGDMGYMDEDQYVYITGRLKSVIVLENGKNIFPEEIEEYLGNIDEIAECVVVGRHTETDTVNLVAIVYPDRTKFPEDATDDMIRDHIWALISELNKTLPTYKHIMELEIRDTEFEKTTSKKIKRHLVK